VNAGLQVEHPVTKESSGIELVLEQSCAPNGEVLRFHEEPTLRGCVFEVRINGEDPGRNFPPAPGRVIAYREPGGPGVRDNAGIEADSVSEAPTHKARYSMG
jgi:acetyl-CoA/propionyl-CoA carboxylase, biotin carboxylase, biotin carboxyl carrier protein